MLLKKYQPLFIFMLSLILFTMGLSSQEVIGFDSRFYLFAQEMQRYGLSWFPTTYHAPYPDYSSASTVTIYGLSILAGELNKTISILPTAVLAAITVALTYMIGGLHSKRWGWYAALLLLLTGAFVKNARAISLDMYPAAVTTACFYLIYAADKFSSSRRVWWIYPLLILSFIFRGPIGLIIPSGVICTYYLFRKQFKKLLLHGLLIAFLLSICIILLLTIAQQTHGEVFMRAVLSMQVLGRMDNVFLPRTFYFTNSFGNYALTYPLACLVLLGITLRGFSAYRSADTTFLFLLAGWVLVILLGMSIPDDKKIRYVLPMAPALALIAAYPFAVSSTRYFLFLRKGMASIFFIFPSILLSALIFLAVYTHHHYFILMLIFAGFQIVNYVVKRDIIWLSVTVLSFMIFQCTVIETWQIEKDKARDFVLHTEWQRSKSHSRLVFYREKPDSLPIKYLIHMSQVEQPLFIADEEALLAFSEPAFFVTSKVYFTDLPPEKFQLIAENTIGHVPVVVFTKKGLT